MHLFGITFNVKRSLLDRFEALALFFLFNLAQPLLLLFPLQLHLVSFELALDLLLDLVGGHLLVVHPTRLDTVDRAINFPMLSLSEVMIELLNGRNPITLPMLEILSEQTRPAILRISQNPLLSLAVHVLDVLEERFGFFHHLIVREFLKLEEDVISNTLDRALAFSPLDCIHLPKINGHVMISLANN